MSETNTITFVAGSDEAIQSAVNFLERFLAESMHCQHYQLTRNLPIPDRNVILSWSWDSPRWQALAWQHLLSILADAGTEFHIEPTRELEAIGA